MLPTEEPFMASTNSSEIAQERSDGWNNAGKGRAANCEMNCTPLVTHSALGASDWLICADVPRSRMRSPKPRRRRSAGVFLESAPNAFISSGR
jgi:Malate:quinone oxidoreductase (Mqo)